MSGLDSVALPGLGTGGVVLPWARAHRQGPVRSKDLHNEPPEGRQRMGGLRSATGDINIGGGNRNIDRSRNNIYNRAEPEKPVSQC